MDVFLNVVFIFEMPRRDVQILEVKCCLCINYYSFSVFLFCFVYSILNNDTKILFKFGDSFELDWCVCVRVCAQCLYACVQEMTRNVQ